MERQKEMAFTGDWLRGARPISELHHLFITELVEEFDAVRLWLVILRNAVTDEMEVTRSIRGKKLLWNLRREIDHGWTEVTKLFLTSDRSSGVRDALINIVNKVTVATTRNRHTRLLPPPVFVEGKLVPPTMPTKPGKFRRFSLRVRSRLKTGPRGWRSMSSTVTSPPHKSLFCRVLERVFNIKRSDTKMAPV